MNLKDFLERRDDAGELYWALVIEAGWIQAGVWEIGDKKAEVISVSSAVAWEEDHELVDAADTALSSAIQSLPEGASEPSKTVFGVSASWVSEGSIKPEYLDKIKKLCSELSLEPKGFVVLPEAVAHLVKSEEGSPLNAIVIGFGKESLEVAVFRLGNLVGTTTVGRSVSVVDDVAEGLSRFASSEALPSRLIVYDGKEGDLEEAKNALINVNWENYEKVLFLHTPKVEIVTAERKVLATAFAGASEIADVSSVGTKLAKDETPQVQEEAVSPESLGFAIGKDIAQAQVPAPTPVRRFDPMAIFNRVKNFPSSFLSVILNFGHKIRLPQGKRTHTTVGVILLAIIVVATILWLFLPKATVTIFVSSKKVEESTKITLDPDASSFDPAKGVLPVSILKTEVSGEKTKAASGTRKVGDRAKGSVKIQNGTASVLNLPAGTVLSAANDLKFTLDRDASVSAALSPSNPGTSEIGVKGADIGAEYNLAKDENFTVGSFAKAEVDAVALADFSGGASREILAVSAEDQKSLENDLTTELSEKAKNELSANLENGKFFIENSLVATLSARSFSGKVGDEADNLKLSLSLKVSAYVANKKDLVTIAKQILNGKVPKGYVLREDQLDFTFDKKNLNLTANLLPEIKPDEIARKISGKVPSAAESYLTAIPGFSRAEITIAPKFPGRFGVIPYLTNHISIILEKEK